MVDMPSTPESEPVTVTELNQQTTAVLRRVKAGRVLPITERGKVVAYLTPPPPTVTGNPTIDRWLAEGRLVRAAVPGTVLDLLPLPEPADEMAPASPTPSSPSASAIGVTSDLSRRIRRRQAHPS
jgi:antitoxin (DNA-binding transcriptional repressor) of toxin-antitoxin stability system